MRTAPTRRRPRALLGLPLLAAAAAGCSGSVEPPPSPADVDALLAPLVAANEFQGAVVLTRGGTVVAARGFGLANREAGLPFTPDTPSDGGSIAKTFTAASVQWLAHEGRLDLDAPVKRYLPEFPHPETTVLHLLSHGNGLPPYYEFFDPFFAGDEVRTTEAMLRVVAREVPAPSFRPGSRFEYSNFGYDVAALVLEHVSGRSYEEFLRERFFDRLGMTSSFARPARLSDWRGTRTIGSRWDGGAWRVVDVFDGEGFLGASNLYVSAADLSRWARAHADRTVLPAEALAAGERRPPIDGRPSPINGLSWYCDDSGNRCYFTGSINAFHSFVFWDRDRNETAVFVSSASLPAWKTITLERNLVDLLAGRLPGAEEARAFGRFTRQTRSSTSGTYAAEGLGTLVWTSDAGGSRLRVGAGLEFDAFQVDPEVFYAPGPDAWIAFGGGTPPSEIHIRSVFFDTVGRRAP